MKEQAILLTGATGFLGSYLTEYFLFKGYKIIILKRSTSDISRIKAIVNKVKIYNLDDVSIDIIFEIERPDIVIHTACVYGRNKEGISEILETNLFFGIKLIELSIKFNVQTFINSDTLLPRSVNSYSLSKAQFRDWLKYFKQEIQIINIRIEHIYGARDDFKKFIPWLINKMINSNEKIKLTTGNQKRDFIHITDVVSAFDVILSKRSILPQWNQFEVGTNKPYEVKEIVLMISNFLEQMGYTKIKARLDFGALPSRKGEKHISKINNSKLLSLGWRNKIPISKGIQEILNIYK